MPKTFGQRLRIARHAAGMSQAELCERAGLPKPSLSRYENDHVLPAITTLRRLARGLGVGEATLLHGESSPEHHLIESLRELGVRIRSSEEAEHLAAIVARIVRRQRASS